MVVVMEASDRKGLLPSGKSCSLFSLIFLPILLLYLVLSVRSSTICSPALIGIFFDSQSMCHKNNISPLTSPYFVEVCLFVIDNRKAVKIAERFDSTSMLNNGSLTAILVKLVQREWKSSQLLWSSVAVWRCGLHYQWNSNSYTPEGATRKHNQYGKDNQPSVDFPLFSDWSRLAQQQ